MSLDLMKGKRTDEQFYVSPIPVMPMPTLMEYWWGRRVEWTGIYLPDGSRGTFISTTINTPFKKVRWYKGDCKCDATATFQYWSGELDNGDGHPYTPNKLCVVMTTTPKEMLSVRLVSKQPPIIDLMSWTNMGGIW